jgi:hypothetical protein
MKMSYHLHNLLAIIHRDGGQHTQEVGVEQSVKDAHQVWAGLQKQIEWNEALAEQRQQRIIRLLEEKERVRSSS